MTTTYTIVCENAKDTGKKTFHVEKNDPGFSKTIYVLSKAGKFNFIRENKDKFFIHYLDIIEDAKLALANAIAGEADVEIVAKDKSLNCFCVCDDNCGTHQYLMPHGKPWATGPYWFLDINKVLEAMSAYYKIKINTRTTYKEDKLTGLIFKAKQKIAELEKAKHLFGGKVPDNLINEIKVKLYEDYLSFVECEGIIPTAKDAANLMDAI